VREAFGRAYYDDADAAVTIVRGLSSSVLQLNVSLGGVPKYAVPEADVTPLGLAGDVHAHPQIHGGPRMAILLITSEGIDELKSQGFPLFYGALGENVTTRGLDRRYLRAGQRYRVGNAILELTKLREPCVTIEIYGSGIGKAVYDAQTKAGDPSSPRWALGGFYASVHRPGTIRAGDPIVLLDEVA
jgi:MOSC domain-containing protein YiiM